MTSRAVEAAKGVKRRMQTTMGRRAYPSDLTDEQWAVLEPFIPQPSTEGDGLRRLSGAKSSMPSSTCCAVAVAFRHVPHDLPAWSTVYSYFRRWRLEGVWDRVLAALRMQMRTRQGRNAEPSAAIIDSQSIKTSAVRGPEKGYDTGKKNLGAQTARPG